MTRDRELIDIAEGTAIDGPLDQAVLAAPMRRDRRAVAHKGVDSPDAGGSASG